jgi:hypothetical protein
MPNVAVLPVLADNYAYVIWSGRRACGRLLDGTPRELWLSLKNYAFCLEEEPENRWLARQAGLAWEKIKQGKPTPPSTLGVEKRTNPFLRADSAEELARKRKRKNNF